MRDREVGERRVLGDALGELDALGEAFAVLDQVMREAHGVAFLGVVDVAGQHHLLHPRHADEPRQPHRGAAADIDAAAAFGQRVVGRALGDAHVRGCGKLEPAADHRAVQHRDHRRLAELDVLECAVPARRMLDAFGGVALGELGEIEARGEVLAFAVEHHGLDVFGQRGEERLQPQHSGVVERVALVRTLQRHDGDVAAQLGRERGGETWASERFAFLLIGVRPSTQYCCPKNSLSKTTNGIHAGSGPAGQVTPL